jgi:adenine-specific DNA methylase
LLPADSSRDKFMHALGIHGDPVASRRRIDAARRQGKRFEGEAYTYPRAFTHIPTQGDNAFVKAELIRASRTSPVILDPTAGGGSIPFEAERLGFETISNDLNPVAVLIERATIEYPAKYGIAVVDEFRRLAATFVERRDEALKPYFQSELEPNAVPTNYLWARTIRCPYCEGIVPLSPNWRLAANGTGVRLQTHFANGPGNKGRHCSFEIVNSAREQSAGTATSGDANCPYSDCGRVITGQEIKRQAQAGEMGEQLYAIVFKRRVKSKTKLGRQGRERWERGFRAVHPGDDDNTAILALMEKKIPDWEVLGVIPTERFPAESTDTRPIQYGMPLWRDLFSPRQLLCHVTNTQIFCELWESGRRVGRDDEVTRAAFIYLALALDSMLNYGNRCCRWDAVTERVRSIFDRHDFAFVSSYAEMFPLATGTGYDWIIEKTAKCIEELVEIVQPNYNRPTDLLSSDSPFVVPNITITCKSGDMLDHLDDGSVDVVVIDPPYYNNVMYAELSDFFYVWLKRTAGHVVPELFTRQLTDKENEAVANSAKFAGQQNALALASRDYQERMARIFEECRRVLKPDGIMTLMFTHKATGAWDALAKGLIEAGFAITASWPINTEAEGSLHIKNRSAANSTIFLVCRPRGINGQDVSADYWEDIEPSVAAAVRSHVKDFQEAGITGVDLYLASFGPALEEFSRHWPLKRGTPRQKSEALRRRRQADMFEEEWNPYAVTPEDALDAARREVKRWRLEQLTHMSASDELDPLTSFFVLAWDAFRAPIFPYDEALRLARAVGVDLDTQVVGVLVEKKGSDLVIWDSARRAAKGALGPPDGRRGMIDALHHAAHLGRTRTLQAAREMLTKTGADGGPMFFAALEAVLEVLPVGKAFSGIDLDGDLAAAGGDFEALENLRRLAFTERVDPPKQLELWLEPATA